MRIESFSQDEIPLLLDAQVFGLHQQAWPSSDSPWPCHDAELRPVTVLLVDGDRVIASLDILTKQLTHHGESYTASGLSTVVTDVRHRGLGHGQRLVTAARDLIRDSGVDLAIFTADRPLTRFYERAGWSVLPETVLVGGTPDEPFPSDRFDKVTFGAFFSVHARRNAHSFAGARVELHPGTIDRLW